MQSQLLSLTRARRNELVLGAAVVLAGAGGLSALYYASHLRHAAADRGGRSGSSRGGKEGGAGQREGVGSTGEESSSKAVVARKGGEKKEGDEEERGGGGGKRKRRGKKGGGIAALGSILRVLLTRMGEKGGHRLAALAFLAVVRTVLSNRLARVQGFLFRAAFLRDVPLFVRLIAENLLLCVGQAALISSSKFLTAALALQARGILTTAIHKLYFHGLAYYRMSHVDKRVDSVEQRIVSDVPHVCNELADLVSDLLLALCDSAFYTASLCSYTNPKYALGILAYVLGAGAVTSVLAPPFGKLLGREQEHEGEYRQLHSRVRTHCESIAFYRGHALESSILSSSFLRLLRHSAGVLHTQWWFGMVQDFFLKYCGATWAVVLIIGPFFGNTVLQSSSDANGEARAQLLSAMRYHTSVVISLFQAMGTLAGSSRRVLRLSGYGERIWELMSVARELGSEDAFKGEFGEAKCIEFEDVTVMTPSGTSLVEGLTLRVNPGNNLLITGPNGSGKSSLFRVLGGLWPLKHGRIWKPGRAADLSHDIFYVPQRPYMAIGTLQEQLIYPLTPADLREPLPEERIREMLAVVDLEELLERYGMDEEVNWGEHLSLGQQQRLGMARLLYHAPAFAILDECTSAVTTDMEERFCERVRAMGTTCVTISHRPALVAFHDTVLALDGEGGWTVHHKRDIASPRKGGPTITELEVAGEAEGGRGAVLVTERKADASVNTRHFMDAAVAAAAATHEGGKAAQQAKEGNVSYEGVLLASSPGITDAARAALPLVPRLDPRQRPLASRMLALWRVFLPRLFSWQGFQLASLGFLVVARTGLSDRIANLNGTSVKNVLQQDRPAFNRLILVSLAQSLASAIIAPTLRHIAASLALGWRSRLSQHLTRLYFKNNAYYKVAALGGESMGDADQRLCDDVSRLCNDVAGLVSSLVKPTVDILWFTWRMRCLTGRRGVLILYAYMLLGLGFLRAITPDFSGLSAEQQLLEGAFRFMHNRLRTHAESVAFFGGGDREHVVLAQRFMRVLAQRRSVMQKRWWFGIADEFITKQLPHNVTWGLSMLYALENPTYEDDLSQGELAHKLRFLASVVSHSFLAFGDILELYRKVQELTGTISRVMQLEEALIAAQRDLNVVPLQHPPPPNAAQQIMQHHAQHQHHHHSHHSHYHQQQQQHGGNPASSSSSLAAVSDGNEVGFREVDVITPSQKLLAYKLTVSVLPGRSLLVTGPNGSGKSSLFRVLGGLWPLVSGSIVKPAMPTVGASAAAGEGAAGASDATVNAMCMGGLLSSSPAGAPGISGATLSGGSFSSSSVNLQGVTGIMFYVPQRPYAPLGTLRDQIIYPLSRAEAASRAAPGLRREGRWHGYGSEEDEEGSGDESFSLLRPPQARETPEQKVLRKRQALEALDEQLMGIMESVRLQYLVEREGGWDASATWEDVLSLGEQQRLGMARLFFHQPVFGILDECTNATSVDVEEALYRKAKELGITVVTISQRPALIPYHSQELRLVDGEGHWELRSIQSASA